MKIILVNPPHWNLSHRNHYPEAPPLGLLYIASMLRKKHDVMVYDAEYYAHSPRSLAIYLKRYNPDIVGFTSTILSFEGMKQSIQSLRKYAPNTKIVVGGSMVSSLTDNDIENEELDYDLLVKGECERNISTLLEEDKRGIVKGLGFKELDDIPFPSRDLNDPPVTRYMGNAPQFGRPSTQMLFSRGCPHNCIFCSNPVYRLQKVRYRSPENIIQEIQSLVTMGIKHIFVYDDELIGLNLIQTQWVKDICNLLIKNRLNKKITYKFQGRCNPKAVTLPLLHTMKKAGFKAGMWGIESGSNKVLQAIKKGITINDIREVLNRSNQAGIKNFGFFMIGNYQETTNDILLTKRLIDELLLDWVQITTCTPLRPSPFYYLNQHNLEGEKSSRVYFQFPICGTDTLSRAEIQEWYFYFDKKYQKRYSIKQNLPRLLFESIFTKKGLRALPYRARKFRQLRKEKVL